jgi:hypothetical protein
VLPLPLLPPVTLPLATPPVLDALEAELKDEPEDTLEKESVLLPMTGEDGADEEDGWPGPESSLSRVDVELGCFILDLMPLYADLPRWPISLPPSRTERTALFTAGFA